jgi:hypothetical protein
MPDAAQWVEAEIAAGWLATAFKWAHEPAGVPPIMQQW